MSATDCPIYSIRLADWVIEKGSIQNNNGDLAMILTETNGGTRLSSTRYVHYGTITAKRML